MLNDIFEYFLKWIRYFYTLAMLVFVIIYEGDVSIGIFFLR